MAAAAATDTPPALIDMSVATQPPSDCGCGCGCGWIAVQVVIAVLSNQTRKKRIDDTVTTVSILTERSIVPENAGLSTNAAVLET